MTCSWCGHRHDSYPCPSTITTRSGKQPAEVACPCQRKDQP